MLSRAMNPNEVKSSTDELPWLKLLLAILYLLQSLIQLLSDFLNKFYKNSDFHSHHHKLLLLLIRWKIFLNNER